MLCLFSFLFPPFSFLISPFSFRHSAFFLSYFILILSSSFFLSYFLLIFSSTCIFFFFIFFSLYFFSIILLLFSSLITLILLFSFLYLLEVDDSICVDKILEIPGSASSFSTDITALKESEHDDEVSKLLI